MKEFATPATNVISKRQQKISKQNSSCIHTSAAEKLNVGGSLFEEKSTTIKPEDADVQVLKEVPISPILSGRHCLRKLWPDKISTKKQTAKMRLAT